MLLYNTFHTDQSNHDHIPFTAPGFPYVCIQAHLEKYAGHQVPWHWHISCEITIVEKGTVELHVPDQKFILHKGDAVFVNTGILHKYTTPGSNPAVVYSHLFRTEFPAGSIGSVFEEKYFRPICRCSALQAWVIHPDSREHMEMIAAMYQAAELMREEGEGYEFQVRNRLCEFWLGLFRETANLRDTAPARNTVDTERLKQMMDYIRDHYSEPLTVEEIGASAGIGIRECSRCFQRCIGTSPISYLTGYRIRAAARMLLETSQSVLEIGENCGFSSPSYFGKVFKEATGLTPKAYRSRAE